MFETVGNGYMANAPPPFMGKGTSPGNKFKNVRIYQESWEKVIGEGKMYETFADVLDRMLDELLAIKATPSDSLVEEIAEQELGE